MEAYISRQPERVIFIAGADHSGSTMLGSAIGAGEDPFRFFHVGELHAYFRGQEPTGVAPFWADIDPGLGPRSAYGQIVARTGARAIVDSSKNLPWLAEQARLLGELGIPLDIVITMRPNASLLHSSLRRGLPVARALRSISYYRNLVETLTDCRFRKAVAVDADEFCRDPVGQLAFVCAAIDVPYFPGKESYWNFKNFHLFGSRIQRQQIRGAIPGGYNDPIPEDDPQLAEARRLNAERRFEPVKDVVDRFLAR